MSNRQQNNFILAMTIIIGISAYVLIELLMSFFFESSMGEKSKGLIGAVTMALVALLGTLMSGKNGDDNGTAG